MQGSGRGAENGSDRRPIPELFSILPATVSSQQA